MTVIALRAIRAGTSPAPTTIRKLAAGVTLLVLTTILAPPLGLAGQTQTPAQRFRAVREKLLFDYDWQFRLGDVAAAKSDDDTDTGALFAKAGRGAAPARLDFDGTNWRVIDLPHDWAVEQEFVNSPDSNVMAHGYKPLGRQFPATSVGWYRRLFFLPASDVNRRIAVKFDGVFRDSTVWLNGHYMGRNESGYSEFSYDITDYVQCGGMNLIAVRVDATEAEGWFYEGAGIYRHAWLLKYGPVHIPEYGVFVHSRVEEGAARVTAETGILNQSGRDVTCVLETSVIDSQGKVAGTAVTEGVQLKSGEQTKLDQQINLVKPNLWSLESPYLYTLESLVKSNGRVIDHRTTRFGIRTIRFDKDRGLFVNDKPVKIKGVCCHQDHAGVGAALPDRLQYFRVEKLKQMGANAYRAAHNPPTTELLEACDRLGMLVVDENRLIGSSPEMMSRFERLVLRDRNHPSVVIWSIGNEERMIQSTDAGRRLAESLLGRLRELDPTRVATYAADNRDQFGGINSVIPVRGFNYHLTFIDKYRKEHPDQPLVGTEVASTLATRGVYADDAARGYLSDYDRNHTRNGTTAEEWWRFYAAREWLAGGFVWTGFDYRGEPKPYGWPNINSHFGVMDMCGFPKNNYYYYQSWWSDRDVLHIAPHWNWRGREGQAIDVWCWSNCESVELFLNGKSMGRKTMEANSHLEWKVPYAPGVIEARGIKNGKEIITRVETTGEAASINLEADRRSVLGDGEDVSVITVTARDEQGREVPTADSLIRFEVSGPGRIIGVGNGDPSSHEPDRYPKGNYQRRLFNGKCQVLIQTIRQAGTIELRATSERLKAAKLQIQTQHAQPRPAVN
ncbi:MAG TPA: beta-galactosidase GalA [Blastocatellia bacterium]|nr:beta-galactosidase GalA [Blastocatellia bacterium]